MAADEERLEGHGSQVQVRVICNGVKAVFLVDDMMFVCQCLPCLRKGPKAGPALFTPTEFEKHAGMAASKKWKYSVRVDIPEEDLPEGQVITIGRWLDDNGHAHRKISTGRARPGITVSKAAFKPGGKEATLPTRKALGPEPAKRTGSAPLEFRASAVAAAVINAKKRSSHDRTAAATAARWGHGARSVSEAPAISPASAVTSAEVKKEEVIEGGPVQQPEPPTSPTRPVRANIASSTPDALLSPASRRRWLSAAELKEGPSPPVEADLPPTPALHRHTRIGDSFQAVVPVKLSRPDKLPDDVRLGEPGPDEAAALAISSGIERAKAAVLPRDAIADVHEEEDARGVPEVRLGLLERGQRERRRPQWLEGQNLYGIRRRKRAELGEEVEGPVGREETPVLEGEAPQEPAGKGLKGRRGRGSQASLADAAEADELDSVAAASAEQMDLQPAVDHWTLNQETNGLSISITLDGVNYVGQLHPKINVPRGARRGRKPRKSMLLVPKHEDAFVAGSMDEDMEDARERAGKSQRRYAIADKGGLKVPRTSYAASEPDEDHPAEEDMEMEAGPAPHLPRGGKFDPQTMQMSERAAKAEERFQRLEEQGAPPGSVCSLCQLEEHQEVAHENPEDGREGRMSLGQLLLVRTSTITHAWAHTECARWCPEVEEKEIANTRSDEVLVKLEGLPEAVRRARRIKCTECGVKGAALGCYAKGCRRSFHLPCACLAGCILKEESLASFCPEHAHLANEEEEEDWGGDDEVEEQAMYKGSPLGEIVYRDEVERSDSGQRSSSAEDAAKVAADILAGIVGGEEPAQKKPGPKRGRPPSVGRSRLGLGEGERGGRARRGAGRGRGRPPGSKRGGRGGRSRGGRNTNARVEDGPVAVVEEMGAPRGGVEAPCEPPPPLPALPEETFDHYAAAAARQEASPLWLSEKATQQRQAYQAGSGLISNNVIASASAPAGAREAASQREVEEEDDFDASDSDGDFDGSGDDEDEDDMRAASELLAYRQGGHSSALAALLTAAGAGGAYMGQPHGAQQTVSYSHDNGGESDPLQLLQRLAAARPAQAPKPGSEGSS